MEHKCIVEILGVDHEEWQRELAEHKKFFDSLGGVVPEALPKQRERLAALMGDGGIHECGYAQNCVEVCPKDIPLTRSIAEVGGEVMKQALGDLFRK